MDNKKIIETINMTKKYNNKVVVDHLSMEVVEGDVYGFIGPNGSGKTTTIRMLTGLINSDEGIIKINGYDLKKDFSMAISQIGAIVEMPVFYPYMCGLGNLNLIARLHKEIKTKRIEAVLDTVGLLDRAKDNVRTYSLGMRQRLGIAAALLSEPKLIILDEPTNGLDPQGVIEMRGLINSLAKDRNISFLISSHSLHEIEQVCSKVGIIQNGKLLKQCSIKEVKETDFENVEIITGCINEAMNLLKKVEYVRSSEITERGIKLCVDKGKSSGINCLLAGNNVFAEYIIPVESSLEQRFLDIVKGGMKNA